MTKQEAIKAMVLGEQITHRYFTKDEFIRMEAGMIIDEKGYTFHPDEFWKWRTSEEFQSGWNIKMKTDDS